MLDTRNTRQDKVQMIEKGNATREEHSLANTGKHMYRINFDLYAEEQRSIADQIQILFHNIITHDNIDIYNQKTKQGNGLDI